MKTSNRKIILTVSVALLVMGISAVTFFALKKDSDLPVFEGKNVRQWFYGEEGHPGREKTIKAAEIAFRNMQTNCVPYLIGRLETSDSFLQKVYGKFYPKLPKKVQFKMPPPYDSIYVHFIAVSHLRKLPISFLDPYAKELLEVLMPGIKNRKHGYGAYELAKTIAVRLEDEPLKKSFFLGLLSDPDPKVRLESAVALSNIAPDEPSGIPILLNALKDSNFTDYWHKFRTKEALARMNQDLVKQLSPISQ